MTDKNFDTILQQLKIGQNPTPPDEKYSESNNSQISSKSEIKDPDFGLYRGDK